MNQQERYVSAAKLAQGLGRRPTPTNIQITIDNSANAADKVVSLFDHFGLCESDQTNDGLISVSTPGGIATLRKYFARHNAVVRGFSYQATSKAQFSKQFRHLTGDFDGSTPGRSNLEAVIQKSRSNMANDDTLLEVPFTFAIHGDMDLVITVGANQIVTLNLNVVDIKRDF